MNKYGIITTPEASFGIDGSGFMTFGVFGDAAEYNSELDLTTVSVKVTDFLKLADEIRKREIRKKVEVKE
jgi:hypothetical protein